MDDSKKAELPAGEKVKSDALRLLSAGPRSVEELRKRLKMKKHAPAAIDEVIELLTKQGFLNDEKYARLLADSRTQSRPVGRRQLAMDLKKKGLSAKVIEGTMADLKDYDEKDAARKAVESRFRHMGSVPPQKKKARLFSFLQRRGFSSDVIFAVLNELVKEDNDQRMMDEG